MLRSVLDEEMQSEGAQYVFATLDAEAIKDLARHDSGCRGKIERSITSGRTSR